MRQCSFLVLLVVIFVACIAALAHAEDSTRISTVKTVLEDLNDATTRRNLKEDNEVAKTEGGSTDAEAEERAFPIKFPSLSGLKSFFVKPSSVGTAAKTNPEFAAAFKNPKVSQAFAEVEKQPGLLQRLKNIPVLSNLATRLRGRSAQFTTRQVTNVGHLAVTTSSSSQLTHMWVKYGAAFLFVVGIAFLATMVYRGLQPK
ncbi:hypothetical protein PHYPSEUDO_015086 [Phytophthora pseudosyringae]|uniref:RxLR effector protein n=1 Tax=Phytophthora pseudosyringae TaxID=221518 RepID=A0A8T1W0J6_9STRA|nr:hypothetical protein PHYPSEUDO_015086 [Phytophthora pseudosyringae]